MTILKLRFVGAGAILAILSACSGSSEPETPSVPNPVVEQAAAPGGSAALPGKLDLVTQAIAKLNLRPEQKTEIDKLVKETTARHQGVGKARGALKDAVAAQLDSGALDRGALTVQVQALEKAIEGTRAEDRAALMRLHAVLDPEQRGQLVDELEASFRSAKKERWSKKGGKHRGFLKAQEWARDLSLTEQQVDQIRSATRDRFRKDGAKRGERFKRFQAARQLAESFRGNEFSLDEAALPFNRKFDRVGKMLDVLDVAVPTLTPDQRKLAAEKLRRTTL